VLLDRAAQPAEEQEGWAAPILSLSRMRGRRSRVQFDTKIAVVLRDDLAVWQKTNVTAFLVSGIAGTAVDAVGAPYRDASGNEYLPMFVQPVLVYEADAAELRRPTSVRWHAVSPLPSTRQTSSQRIMTRRTARP
jgi:hypothetical protein